MNLTDIKGDIVLFKSSGISLAQKTMSNALLRSIEQAKISLPSLFL